MSLEKAITHGKEYRAPYYRGGRYDRTCRPHGGCPWCLKNRSHQHLKQQAAAADSEQDHTHGELEQRQTTSTHQAEGAERGKETEAH